MKELKKVTILEGLLTNDREIKAYSEKLLSEKFGLSEAGLIAEAYRKGYELPDVLAGPECSELWKNVRSPFFMSVPSIMDFYYNGPKSLSGNIKEQLILSHQNYIYYIMKHYFSSYMPLYTEDLYNCGVVGVLKAMHSYNGENAFSTYSKYFIIHEMFDFIYYLQGIPSYYYARLQKKIRNAIDDGLEPDVSEIVRRTGIKRDIVIRELRSMRAADFVYMDESPAFRDKIEDERENIEEEVENKVMLSALRKAIECLDEEEKEILLMYFGKNYSLMRIARETGICYSRVKKLYKNILDKLKTLFLDADAE